MSFLVKAVLHTQYSSIDSFSELPKDVIQIIKKKLYVKHQLTYDEILQYLNLYLSNEIQRDIQPLYIHKMLGKNKNIRSFISSIYATPLEKNIKIPISLSGVINNIQLEERGSVWTGTLNNTDDLLFGFCKSDNIKSISLKTFSNEFIFNLTETVQLPIRECIFGINRELILHSVKKQNILFNPMIFPIANMALNNDSIEVIVTFRNGYSGNGKVDYISGIFSQQVRNALKRDIYKVNNYKYSNGIMSLYIEPSRKTVKKERACSIS